jgi:hypothetical protein
MQRGPVRLLACLSLVMGVSCPAPFARAQTDRSFQFEWTAPDSCPSVRALEAEIDQLLGGPARERVRENLVVRAAVEHAAQWSVTLETTSPASTGHRTIEAATCQALANASALIVALMIDPDAVAAHSAQAKPEPPPSPAPAPPPLPALPDAPAPRKTHALVGLVAAGNLGMLPKPDVGPGIALGLLHKGWRLMARAAVGLRAVDSDPLSGPDGAYGRFRFFTGTLVGCWTHVTRAFDIGPCADVEIGAVRGEGKNTARDHAATVPWFGVGVGTVTVWKANPWLHFPLHLDAVMPIHGPDYVLGPSDTPLFTTWRVGGRLTIGVELQF